mmetsp:Transcript_30699/g.74805  ORF Transcript_30699/g.74805 Transcript_30699/m.74805 type:complete len:222 (+) Transcript_30699:199-864(+)
MFFVVLSIATFTASGGDVSSAHFLTKARHCWNVPLRQTSRDPLSLWAGGARRLPPASPGDYRLTSIGAIDSKETNFGDDRGSPRKVEVWIGQHPLVGGPEWLQLHQAVWIRDTENGECTLHDFLPVRTDPINVLPMIFMKPVPGRIRTLPFKSIKKMVDLNNSFGATYRCPPLNGQLACTTDAVHSRNIISSINSRFDHRICLINNDCYTYVEELRKHLCL